VAQYTCAHCADEFDGRKRKYCTSDCAKRANVARSSAVRRARGNWRELNYTTPGVCISCSTPFIGKASQGYCTKRCANKAQAAMLNATPRAPKPRSTELAVRYRPRVHVPTVTSGRTWVSGPCAYCGEVFTAQRGGRYCSANCKWSAKFARSAADRGTFNPTPKQRSRIYVRDAGVCHICGFEVRREWQGFDLLARSLDHITPQSHAVKSDHSDENLRLAHFVCNAIRQDQQLSTELSSRCRARVLELLAV
jgi:hypothetical protein